MKLGDSCSPEDELKELAPSSFPLDPSSASYLPSTLVFDQILIICSLITGHLNRKKTIFGSCSYRVI